MQQTPQHPHATIHYTLLNASCHTRERVMSHTYTNVYIYVWCTYTYAFHRHTQSCHTHVWLSRIKNTLTPSCNQHPHTLMQQTPSHPHATNTLTPSCNKHPHTLMQQTPWNPHATNTLTPSCNKTLDARECVISHECVMSHSWRSHVTHIRAYTNMYIYIYIHICIHTHTYSYVTHTYQQAAHQTPRKRAQQKACRPHTLLLLACHTRI